MPGNVLPNEEILTDLVTRFILNVPYSEWEYVGSILGENVPQSLI